MNHGRRALAPSSAPRLALSFAALLLVGGGVPLALAQAEQRPSESDIFGPPGRQPTPRAEPSSTPPRDPAPAGKGATPAGETPAEGAEPAVRTGETAPADTPEAERDAALLGGGPRAFSEDAAPEDPLKIGGMFYLRAQTSGRQGDTPNDWALTSPNLLDVYLDARPNERVRGFILGRLFFDPTQPRDEAGGSGDAPVDPSMGGTDVSSLFTRGTRGPVVILDQMWLRFDLAHTVFVTAGKQHARWGTGRFWSPTDYLHVVRRDPLALFDARSGTTMLKLHLPWEERGWNFYAYGLLEDIAATDRLGKVAGAARAEIVLGTAELGLGAVVQDGHKPKYALDLSAGVWDIDLHGELALRYGSEIDRVVFREDIAIPTTGSLNEAINTIWPVDRDPGLKAQAVVGASYERKYNDNDVWRLGMEYFYNGLGYSSPKVYPGLLIPRLPPLVEPAMPFYLGRHYGAVYLSLPAPYSWNYHTFTLSTLGNLSDQSFITRLDYALVLLTHLTFEAYAAVRYGTNEGEFRFGVNDLQIGPTKFSLSPALLDFGVALRVNI